MKLNQTTKCKAGHYIDNSPVIISRPLVCYGYKPIEQPQCPYLEECLNHYGFYMDNAGRRRKIRNGEK